MKTISNKIIVAGAASLVLVLTPITPTLAVENIILEDRSQSSVACTHMATLKSNNESTIEARLSTLRANFEQRATKIASDETTVEQKVTAARLAAKTQFEEKIQTMLAQENLTEAQIQAINTFKANMEQAEATRAAAVDAARSEYRTTLQSTVETHQQALINAAVAYQTAVKTAFDSAVTECGNGNAATTLRSAIKTARQELTTARETTKVMSTVRQLAATRNTAIKAANQAFADSVATFAATLTAALETTDTTQ